MFMIFFVMDQSYDYERVLAAWQDAGAPGITILRTTGVGRVSKHRAQRDDLPLFPGLENLFEQDETMNYSLVSIVPDHDTVDRIVHATQDITGDLDTPDTGILAVLPVLEAYGLKRRQYPAD